MRAGHHLSLVEIAVVFQVADVEAIGVENSVREFGSSFDNWEAFVKGCSSFSPK